MKHALIVIDLIEDYFDAAIWPRSVIPSRRTDLVDSTNALVAGCRRAGVPVIWVRQEFSEDMSDAFAHALRSGMRYAVRGTRGSRLLFELDVRSEDAVIEKKRFSAFFGTSLTDMLAGMGVSTLILAGITTAWCVRSTATDAYQMDHEVIIAGECTAAFETTAHDEALKAMDGYVAEVMTNAEIVQRIM